VARRRCRYSDPRALQRCILAARRRTPGRALALIPGVLVTMNIIYAALAYPLGRLSDCRSRRPLLLVGVGILISADIVLATANTVGQVVIGAAIWGLHMGATQGLLSALVVGTAPAHLRGTAFGFYSLITGAALLAASVVAGWLWTAFGPAATFMAGALFAGLALIGIVLRASPEAQKSGLVRASLVGGWHLLWAIIVALGWGQPLIDFIF